MVTRATKRALSQLLCLWFLATPLTTGSASFDCANAKTVTEKTICADEELSILDEKLASRFSASLSATSSEQSKGTLRQEQRDWLKIRDACRTRACFAE